MNSRALFRDFCARARRVRGLAVTCLMMWGVVGCATKARFQAEVLQAREQAARDWIAAEAPDAAVFLEGPLSLDEAVRLALAHNKDFQAAGQELAVARGRILESYGAALPHASASAGYTRLDEVPRVEMGPQSVSLGFEDNYEARVSLYQPLFHGPAIPAALRTAKWYALWSEEAVRAARQGVIFQTCKDYDDVLLAEVLVKVHEEALRFAEAMREDVKRKRDQGVVSDYDVLRAEVEVSNARAEWIRQKHERDVALTRLLKTLGASARSRVTLTGELAYDPARSDLDEAMATALRNRPELLQAEYAVRMQREAVRVAHSAFWPEVRAFFSQEWSRPDPHVSTLDEWGDAWNAGVSATLPLFEGMARRGKLVQERARLEQAEVRRRAQEDSVALEVQEAVLNVLNAQELVDSQRTNLERAQEGLRLVQAGYREGIKTQVDVLDAQTALTRTQALYYQALYAHRLARLSLERALGVLGQDEADEARPPPAAEHDL